MSNQSIFDNFVKSYEDKTYKYPTLVRHKGTVIAFAMDNERRIYYTVLDLSDSDENKSPIDVEYWSKNPSKLHFTNEIAQVGYGLLGATGMPTVKKGTRTEDRPENLKLDEIDDFLSTTARLTADAPFQVISDDQYIYVFRQSIADSDSDMVYQLTRLAGGGSSGDTTRQDSEFVLSGGKKVPIVDNTLLLDRFILLGTQLQPKMEVRYKRSRNKTQPANNKDSLGAKDMEGKAFYEPTQELDFVQQLQGGRFQVLLLPTQIANIKRWQVFAYNSATSKIDSFNIERAGDGLFNTKGTIYYTSPDPKYQDSVYQRQPGECPFTKKDLVPILNIKGAAESALSFDGTDDYVDLKNPTELKITGNQTIEMWVKPLSLAKRQSLFCKAYNGEGAITLEVDGKLSYYYGTGGDNPTEDNMDINTFQSILSNLGLLRNEWSHIAIVRDFESKTLTWYIDGASAGEEIITKDAAVAGNENVFFGKGYADSFIGCIDEVRIWNRARSRNEINEDRSHRLVGREPGLVGYWRFDENSGDTVYDQTDSANNGTIHGATWQESDALIGNNPGMSRDSFSFDERSIESGLTAVQYFQQEDAQVGNEQEGKPMKTNARVMLAVATGGNDAEGATTTKKYVAALDFAVSREGRLARVQDNISLNWLNRTDLDGDSIKRLFQEVKSLENEIKELKSNISMTQEQIEELGNITNFSNIKQEIQKLIMLWLMLQQPQVFNDCFEESKGFWQFCDGNFNSWTDFQQKLSNSYSNQTIFPTAGTGGSNPPSLGTGGSNRPSPGTAKHLEDSTDSSQDENRQIQDTQKILEDNPQIKKIQDILNQNRQIRNIWQTLNQNPQIYEKIQEILNQNRQIQDIRDILNHNEPPIQEKQDENPQIYPSIEKIQEKQDENPQIYPSIEKIRKNLDENQQIHLDILNILNQNPKIWKILKDNPKILDEIPDVNPQMSQERLKTNDEVPNDSEHKSHTINKKFEIKEWFNGPLQNIDSLILDLKNKIPKQDTPQSSESKVLLAAKTVIQEYRKILECWSNKIYGRVPYETKIKQVKILELIVGDTTLFNAVVKKPEILKSTNVSNEFQKLFTLDDSDSSKLENSKQLQQELEVVLQYLRSQEVLLERGLVEELIRSKGNKEEIIKIILCAIVELKSGTEVLRKMEVMEKIIAKSRTLTDKKQQLESKVSLPMALLHTDSDGLSSSGALLSFVHTCDTPQLFDSAMGKLALYFQGSNKQFFTAYYDTKTARAQKTIDIGGKKVHFIARSVGAESNTTTITISDGNNPHTCQVTIANSQRRIAETWEDVPRDPRMFSKVLNGQAKPLYLAAVAATSGTVTELTLTETTNRKLAAAGAKLRIGETTVTTSAAVPVKSSSIPVNSVSLDVEEETSVYLVIYDYSANPNCSLENGSRQFLVYSEAIKGKIPNGTVRNLEDAPSCRWVADPPGLALNFNAQNKYLALPDNKLAQMDATANLTLEGWVKPTSIAQIARLIHHKSANSQYTLGLKNLMSALEFDGSTNYIEIGEFDPGKTFTIELWVNPKNKNGQCFFGKNTSSGGNIFLFGYWGQKLQVDIGDNEQKFDKPEITLNTWQHLAVVVKKKDNRKVTVTLYKDGVKGDSHELNIIGDITGKPWTLGQEWDSSSKSDFFNGQMDEVRVWNYARTENEINADKDRRLSGNEVGLAGYWHFEGGVARDYSSKGNNGTIHGNKSNVISPLNAYQVFAGVGERFLKAKNIILSHNWNHFAVSYHQSYALKFDGNDYLDCGKNRALNLCEDLTIEIVVWVSDSKSPIISKGIIGSRIEKESVPYDLRIEAGKLIFSFEDSQGTIHKLESPANKIQTNKVHEIAVTRKKNTDTTDSGADPDAWGTRDVADIDAKTGDFDSSENKKIDKAMKADYVASKKRAKILKEGLTSKTQKKDVKSQTYNSISTQGTTQRLELKMYIDETLVSSQLIGPAVSPEGNSQPLEIGRIGDSYFKGKISEVKLWSRALEKGEIHQNLTGREEGLVAWWQLEENEGNLANDFKGGNHAQIKGATWCKNPDEKASELLLYNNGVLLPTEPVGSSNSWGDNQFTLGGRKSSTSYQECFNGVLEEVRVWKVVRTQEQILDNIFTRLKGEKQDLLANYTFDEIIDNEVKDRSLIGNHLPLGADANQPTSVLSNAPISNDTPQVRPALAAIQTSFNTQIDSSPAVTEYGDMQYDSQQNLTGVFKRCYTYIKDGKWQLVTGYKVGNLITEWVSQVQFDPQIIGYIEGAPPIPGENMTAGPIDTGDTDTYKEASTVELIEAEEVNYSFSSSKENGFDSSFEAAMSAGVELDLRTLLAPLGFGVSFKAQVAFNVSSSSTFQSSGSWTEEKTSSSGRTVTRNMRASALGYWEDKNNLLNARLGQRYVLNNKGFALVQSETADVFALRLAHNKALISYRFQPNPDIPKDWNIIPFPINSRYTQQGTLDGKVGFKPDGSVQTDPSYPQATQYGEYSYFKPIEAYALKRQIEREAAELKNYYQNYNASPLSNSILKNVMGSNAGLLAGGAAAIPGGGIGLGAATTFGSLADALSKDQKLPEKFATRNIVNTYVWTADGGFYAETTNTMDVRQESSSGSYSFNTNFTGGISLNVSAAASVGFDLNGSMGGHMNMTQSKSAETSKSFQVEVQVNPQNDLYQYEVPEAQKDSQSTSVDYLLQYDIQGNPIKVPGKVDAYRFMTFYLEPKAENFEDFYGKVVDPIWIEQSNDPNAIALREARQSEKKPACWRIMHRVTFVSRVLQDFNDDAASQLAKDARALNIESNWQLIKTLEPFVKNKTDNFVQLADAVRDALKEYLPELQPYSKEIIGYMAEYYGLPEDA